MRVQEIAPSGGSAVAPRPIGGALVLSPILALGEIGCLQSLLSVINAHALASSDARGPDRDGYGPEGDDADDAHYHYSQTSFAEFLAANAETAGPSGGVSVGSGTTPTQAGTLLLCLELLSAPALGSMVYVSTSANLLPTWGYRPSAEGQGDGQADERREAIPQQPERQPFVPPPRDSALDTSLLLASLGEPFAQLFPIDVAAIQRSADAFFERLTHLSEEWKDGQCIHELTPWLLAAWFATYEWVRLRRMRTTYTVGYGEISGDGSMSFLAGDEG